MSAIGPKRTSLAAPHMSAFGGKADMTVCGNPLSRSLLGAKRTCPFALHMSANDPKRTSLIQLQPVNFREAPFYGEQLRCDCAGYKPGPRRLAENGCDSRLHQFAEARFAPR